MVFIIGEIAPDGGGSFRYSYRLKRTSYAAAGSIGWFEETA
jgi:hypothetical protein